MRLARELIAHVFADLLAGVERIHLPGFGVFRVTTRAARSILNPQTQEAMVIGPTRELRFRAAKAVRAALAAGRVPRYEGGMSHFTLAHMAQQRKAAIARARSVLADLRIAQNSLVVHHEPADCKRIADALEELLRAETDP